MPALTEVLPIDTARLRLRPFRASDAAVIDGLCGDYEVARTTALIPHPYPDGLARSYIAGSLQALPLGRDIALAIAIREDDTLVGAISLQLSGGGGCTAPLSAEIGYWLGRQYWGCGFATEAVDALCVAAWTHLGVSRVVGSVMPGNPRSERVLEKAGFIRSGTQSADFPVRGWRGSLAVFERIFDPALRSGSRRVVLVVAACLVDADGRVLLAQRPAGKSMAGLWEFPGGKVADGETPEAALVRELREELDIDTSRSCLAPYTFASHAYEDFHLIMPLFVCRVWTGTPRPMEGQRLAWVRANRLAEYPMPPADIPLIAMIRDLV